MNFEESSRRIDLFLRIPLLLLLGYFTIRIISGKEYALLINTDLVFHEAGHTIFFFGGEFLNIFGGTLMQIIVPLILALYFYRKGNAFSAVVVLWWLGENLVNISVYASDARAQELPLIASGLIHDWNYMFGRLGLLESDLFIGSLIWTFGIGSMIISVLYALFMAFKAFYYRN